MTDTTPDDIDAIPDKYFDRSMIDAAIPIYEAEVSLSQHYETLRATVTGFNLAAVGAILATSSEFDGRLAAVFLVLLAIAAGFLSLRICHAQYYHLALAKKMRGIIAKHNPKTFEKLNLVRREWCDQTRAWQWLRHAPLWVGLNFGAPLVFAVILGLREAFPSP